MATALDPASEAALELTVFVSCYNESAFITNTLNTLRAALGELGLSKRLAGRHHRLLRLFMVQWTPRSPSILPRIWMQAHPAVEKMQTNLRWAVNHLNAALLAAGANIIA